MTKVAAILALVLILVVHAMSGFVSVGATTSSAAGLSADTGRNFRSVIAGSAVAHSALPDALPGVALSGLHCAANCPAIVPGAATVVDPIAGAVIEISSFRAASSASLSLFRPPIV